VPEHMPWERNADYRGGARCLVCGRRTRQLAAPLGILSGSFPCHLVHDNVEIRLAYFDWLSETLITIEQDPSIGGTIVKPGTDGNPPPGGP